MSPTEIKHILDIATIVMVVFIVLAAMAARIYVNRAAKRRTLDINRRWIESLPSMISTLGVLGTFGGITLGLLFFNTNNLNVSIPLLLSGLKTAFFTSLAGMIGSLLLNRKVASLYDKQSGGVNDTTSFYQTMNAYAQEYRFAVVKQINLMQSQATTMKEQNKLLAGMVESVNGKLDVLTQKFEDFSEMLKKSNTVALVEVMEKLTEEFQKQMGTLIERLVQKNFDQLTQSVDRLNLWQQENKNQVATLIQQFKDIESDFETSSTTLKKGFCRHPTARQRGRQTGATHLCPQPRGARKQDLPQRGAATARCCQPDQGQHGEVRRLHQQVERMGAQAA